MSKKYNMPPEVRELDKLIASFAEKYGLDRITIFRDFLRFVINGWTLPGFPGLTDWKYTPEQNTLFGGMNDAWIRIMDEQLKGNGFFDAFARLHPAYSADKDRQSKGQFMTPPHIAQLMAGMVPADSSKVGSVADPTGGSGGLLLASHAQNPKNFHVSMDVDYTMCLQAVCNFIIHGVVGMVVCINTLTLKDFRGGWLVNELLYRTGLPTVRPLTEDEYLIHSNNLDRTWIYFLNQTEYDQFEKTHKTLSLVFEAMDKPI
jgi:type I restriction enzyme M protein